MTQPDVSYICTVYNKEPYIGYTIDSLIAQQGDFTKEFVLVDDVSTDASMDVVRKHTKDLSNVTIIENTENKGPSVRVNQAAAAAKGKYLQFIDSDDVLIQGATQHMLNLLKQHNADVIYGRWEKTGLPSAELLEWNIDTNAKYYVGDTPLEFVLKQRVLRMTQLVERDTFIAAGGCDERVFIQDETLALRLAAVAKKMLLLDTATVLVPKLEGELSGNRSQLNHDRFLAYYYMLLEKSLPSNIASAFYHRALACKWKECRDQKQLMRSLLNGAFLEYITTKYLPIAPQPDTLRSHYNYFNSMNNIKRTA